MTNGDGGHELVGTRVRATVGRGTYTGTVTDVAYTLKGGQPVVRISVADAPSDDERSVAAPLSAVEPVSEG